MSHARIATVLAMLVLVVACASNPERRQMEADELAIYQSHAGEPVDRIHSFRMLGWQPVSDQTLILENRLNDWYLIDVSGPCQGLRFAQTILIETHMNTLQSRFDSITVDGFPCRIETIRPVDARAARDEIRNLRASRS